MRAINDGNNTIALQPMELTSSLGISKEKSARHHDCMRIAHRRQNDWLWHCLAWNVSSNVGGLIHC